MRLSSLYLACVRCVRREGSGWLVGSRQRRLLLLLVFLLLLLPRLMSMGHCSEQRTAFEVTKDWNGADQVVIRSPRGASVRVSRFCSPSVSDWRSARHFCSRQRSFFSV